MNTKKENKNKKKPWIQYGIFAIVAISLYTTGLHTEVIGFAQRGLLATGLMNPDIEEIAQVRKNDKNNDEASMPNLTKADLNLKLIELNLSKR